jgi:F0F1-type ATP synthase membrane subunit c/vacuolar-type H+-ATPase subunit K
MGISMNNDLIFIAIGVIYGIAYMVAGLGVTRAGASDEEQTDWDI